MNDGKRRANWADLPPELTASILVRLSVIDILEKAQRACRSWRRVCTKDPSMWRRIEMPTSDNMNYSINLQAICRHAIDLSQGGLLEIYIEDLAADSLLSYIADSSSNLRRLGLATSYNLTMLELEKALVKLPLLEDFELSHCEFADLGLDLKVVGRLCPLLKTLKLNRVDYYGPECDDEAFAIAETMPGLRHLQLFGNGMSDTGLNAILDGCLHLEYLDLRHCFGIKFVGDLRKRCSERIKDVRGPTDSSADYPYLFRLADHQSEDEEVHIEASEEEEEEEDYSYGSDDNEYVYIFGDVDNHSDMDD